MHFEENQLSPRSIGISPLPTVLPSCLQPTPVRPSTRCYPRFSLTMGRSRGFGSNPRYHTPQIKLCGDALFRLAFALPSQVVLLKRQRRLTRRLILQKARRHTVTPKERHGAPTACRRHGFSYCFTPLPGCFSPFPHGTGSLSVAESI
jgi:hypothetical protein